MALLCEHMLPYRLAPEIFGPKVARKVYLIEGVPFCLQEEAIYQGIFFAPKYVFVITPFYQAQGLRAYLKERGFEGW